MASAVPRNCGVLSAGYREAPPTPNNTGAQVYQSITNADHQMHGFALDTGSIDRAAESVTEVRPPG
jgi:hypothetical protein